MVCVDPFAQPELVVIGFQEIVELKPQQVGTSLWKLILNGSFNHFLYFYRLCQQIPKNCMLTFPTLKYDVPISFSLSTILSIGEYGKMKSWIILTTNQNGELNTSY